MTATDWVAIVGALAWAPQLATWIRELLARPKLTLYPSPSPEIGFTVYGTVLNLSCAISAAVDDAVIERMDAELTHERGQRFVLPWRGLHETLAEIEMPTGEIERHRRQQTALALKVSTVELAEQVVMFQDVEFQNRLLESYAALEKRRDLVEKHPTVDSSHSTILRSDEMSHLANVIRSGMLWQEGWYTVIFRAKISERETPFEFEYRLHVSAADLHRLTVNIEKLVTAANREFEPDSSQPTIEWNWRYPTMLPRSKDAKLALKQGA